jgi:uncharacterized RDD family membrane protein YckC
MGKMFLKEVQMIEENTGESVSQVRPWVRYFDRSIDMIILGIVIGFIRLFIDPSANYNSNGVGFVMLIIWIFIEARMISHSGCTPGKRLLKTKVFDKNNNKLTFAQALKRSFLVWFMGMGLGIFSLITMIIGFFELRKEKTTSWINVARAMSFMKRLEF